MKKCYYRNNFKSVAILMHEVSNNTSPSQISNLFNYQNNIPSHDTRSLTRGNFFLEYSRLDKQNMSFSRNGVRIWNNFKTNEIRQMPKAKFECKYILICWIWMCLDVPELILSAIWVQLSRLYYSSSFSCNRSQFSDSVNVCLSQKFCTFLFL